MSLPPNTAIYIPSHPNPDEIRSEAPPPPVAEKASSSGKKKRGRKAAVVEQGDDGSVAADGANANEAALTDSEAMPGEEITAKKRCRISVLTHHEALSSFADKGIYVSEVSTTRLCRRFSCTQTLTFRTSGRWHFAFLGESQALWQMVSCHRSCFIF